MQPTSDTGYQTVSTEHVSTHTSQPNNCTCMYPACLDLACLKEEQLCSGGNSCQTHPKPKPKYLHPPGHSWLSKVLSGCGCALGYYRIIFSSCLSASTFLWTSTIIITPSSKSKWFPMSPMLLLHLCWPPPS